MSTPVSPTLSALELLSMSSRSTTPQDAEYTRHAKHYVGDLLVLQVEHHLYHVSLAVLRKFQYFQNLLGQEGPPSIEGGSDDGHPLFILGIKSADMECLLDVLQTRCLQGHEYITFQQWAGALHLATQWDCESLRKFIIPRMDDAVARRDPFECIDIAGTYQVQSWLTRAYKVLCERPERLSDVEGQRLGMKRTLAIMNIREKRANLPPHAQPDSVTLINHEEVLREFPSEVAPPQPFSSSAAAERHSRHYQADLIVILVRGTLYRVSGHLFAESAVIQDLIAKTGPTSDIEPLELNAAESDDAMGCLLDILDARLTEGEPTLSFSQLASALHLATFYGLGTVRNYIVDQMGPLLPQQLPVDVIETARKCQVACWLPTQYIALCERKKRISDREAERLGLATAMALSRVRERAAAEKTVSTRIPKGCKKCTKTVPVSNTATVEWIKEEPTLIA